MARLHTGPSVDRTTANDEHSAHRHHWHSHTLHDLKDEDLKGLAPEAIAQQAMQMVRRIRQQDSEIQYKDAKIETITLQLMQCRGGL